MTESAPYGAYDGEDVIALSVGPDANQILLGIGGHAPAGLSSNETILTDVATGARLWRYGTRGDSQAVGTVGDTAVAGYHNSTADDPATSPNYFGIQLDDTNAAATSWDPAVQGSVNGNADGGNGGVQAIYVNQTTDTLYMGGAFTSWDNTEPRRQVPHCVLVHDRCRDIARHPCHRHCDRRRYDR